MSADVVGRADTGSQLFCRDRVWLLFTVAAPVVVAPIVRSVTVRLRYRGVGGAQRRGMRLMVREVFGARGRQGRVSLGSTINPSRGSATSNAAGGEPLAQTDAASSTPPAVPDSFPARTKRVFCSVAPQHPITRHRAKRRRMCLLCRGRGRLLTSSKKVLRLRNKGTALDLLSSKTIYGFGV